VDIAIPSDLEQFVASAVRDGAYENPSAVVAEALRLLEKRERLRRDVAAGVEQLESGQYTEYGEGDRDAFHAAVRAEEAKMFDRESGNP
jgi:putative addiction module CopG family antidote